MRPEDHVRRLLRQSDRTPSGQLERALLQSAADLSDALGDAQLGYESRLRLSAWAAASGDSTTRLRAFDRCLEEHLADPLRFPAVLHDLDLLWDFASIPRLLAASPRYDRATIESCLDEMLQTYSFHGADLRAFDFARFEVAAAMGDEALATEALARVGVLESHRTTLVCDACVLSAGIAWHAEHGRFDRAAALADRLRAEGAACANEPELGLARSLLPYLLTGRVADAFEAHRDGYERVRGRSLQLHAVALHLEFAVVVGDRARALDLVERHAEWLGADPLAGSSHFAFLCAVGAAMDAVTRSGEGGTPVNPRGSAPFADHLGTRVGGWTATSLAKASWTAAASLADAFDARNGTDRCARRLAASRDRRPLMDGGGQASRSPGRASTARGGASEPQPDASEPSSARELLARARESASVGDRPAAEELIARALPRADPVTRSELFALRIRMLVERGELRAAEEQLERRIECLVLDGLDEDADLDRRLGLLLFGAPIGGRTDRLQSVLDTPAPPDAPSPARMRVAVALACLWMEEGRAVDAERLLSTALTGITDVRRSQGLLVLADAHFALGNADQAQAMIVLLLDDPLDRAIRAAALLRRASVLFLLGSSEAVDALDRAVDDADRALGLFVDLDHCEGVLEACGVLGHLLRRAGSIDGSLEALRTACRTARRFEHPDSDAMAFRYARALVHAGRAGEAREVLEDVLERAAERDRGELFYWLGHACRQEEDDPAAYCIWSLALEQFARAADHHAAARAGIALGRLLLDNDDPDAVAVLHEACRRAKAAVDVDVPVTAAGQAPPAATLMIDARHLLGRAQVAFGDAAGLRTLDAVVTEATALNRWEPLLEADILESRAQALDTLDALGPIAGRAAGAPTEGLDTAAAERVRPLTIP